MSRLAIARDGARRLRGWTSSWRGRHSGGSPLVGGWLQLVLAVLGALFLCSSVFHFAGHKVDESEVVINALAIATGDWNPVWNPGYGHLAMYLPAAALALVAFFLQASGAAASYSDGLYLLFVDGAAYRIVRLLYTLADVATALVLARVIVLATRQRLLAAAFLLYFFVSPDTWLYANFVRTDTLVSLFIACAVLALTIERRWFTPYLLGIALGAAIACKYSAAVYVALCGLLLLPAPGEGIPDRFGTRFGMAATAAAMAVLATFVFQPLYDYSGILSAIGKHLSGAKFAQEAVPLADRLSRLWGLVKMLEPLALVLIALMTASVLRWRRSLPLLAAVVLGIAPFVLSNFAREYWLLPFADALRAAGWLGVACLVQLAGARLGETVRRVLVVLLLLLTVAVAANRLPGLLRTHAVSHRGLSNVEAARRWLYVHAANRVPLVYGYEKNYLLPRAYSFANYQQAADFSRVFIFYREDFQSLHELFRRRLYSHEYAEFSSVTAVPPLRLSMSAMNGSSSGSVPKVCAGTRCYSPHETACSARARSQLDNCVAYTWDMDRPSLRRDLGLLALELPASAADIAVCWYNCGNADAETVLPGPHKARVPLLQIAGQLFASADVLRLTQIKKLDNDVPVYVVTTPKAYVPWLPPEQRKKGASPAFAKAIGARLIRYFDEGSGPPIQIYVKPPRP